VGLITRIGQAPCVRRLVPRREDDGVVTENLALVEASSDA
jgi:hypothetical protein